MWERENLKTVILKLLSKNKLNGLAVDDDSAGIVAASGAVNDYTGESVDNDSN